MLSWLQNHNLLLQILVAGDGLVPLWPFWIHLASCTCRVTWCMWASLALLESGPTGLITEHSFHKIRYQDIIFKVSLAFAPQVQTRDCFLSAGPCATHGTRVSVGTQLCLDLCPSGCTDSITFCVTQIICSSEPYESCCHMLSTEQSGAIPVLFPLSLTEIEAFKRKRPKERQKGEMRNFKPP